LAPNASFTTFWAFLKNKVSYVLKIPQAQIFPTDTSSEADVFVKNMDSHHPRRKPHHFILGGRKLTSTPPCCAGMSYTGLEGCCHLTSIPGLK